jgi:hypothetical protein
MFVISNSTDLFLFFSQIGNYAAGSGDGTGRPDFWVPAFDKAYEDFVLTHKNTQDLSEEMFLIFKQMMKFDYFHKYLEKYFELEAVMRKNGQSTLTYDLDSLIKNLDSVKPLFAAQYSQDARAKLDPQTVADDLLTATGGRIVRLKDYLFFRGPVSQIPEADLLNHLGQKIDWPSL